MSVEQYQREVNSLDSDIAKLQDKKAKADKKYADLQKKIMDASSAANRTKSATTFKSKMRQIEGWNKDSGKASKESTDLSKKIAEKTKKRNDAYSKLQKAEQQQKRKEAANIKRMQESYEERINELELHAEDIRIPLQRNAYQESDEEYDVFISHAWEDKEPFVNELVEELKKLNIKVWYDQDRIPWGSSMRAKIDEGLRKSKFGIAIISHNYIAEEKYWTKAELDGLFQLESINGKVILPIWYNISKKDVMAFSSILGGRKAMTNASMTAEEIAIEMRNLLENLEK